MIHSIRLPHLNANDESAKVIHWAKSDGHYIHKGDLLCTLESTKTTFDLESSGEGYLYTMVRVGETISTHSVVAVVASEKGLDKSQLLEQVTPSGDKEVNQRRWTKKAALVANRSGLDINEIAAKRDNDGDTRLITEADVQTYINTQRQDTVSQDKLTENTLSKPSENEVSGTSTAVVYAAYQQERVLLLGGGGGGGIVALDIIERSAHQKAVGILDNNLALKGEVIRGVPVLGGFDDAISLWEQDYYDGVIIVFTGDLELRAEWFHRLREAGVRMTNVIDPSVILRPTQEIGEGNLIVGHCYIAAQSIIGDNNFLASHVCIEHHNVIGNHCSFGPRTSTSGAVRVGDFAKLGMHVAIEPYLSIGSRTLIASGVVITHDIPEGAVVKATKNFHVR